MKTDELREKYLSFFQSKGIRGNKAMCWCQPGIRRFYLLQLG